MATEKGIVTKVGATTAWVKTSRSSACEGCASRGACQQQGDSREVEVEALNEAGAHVGDRILLQVASAALLKISFLLYVFPILLMLFGAAIGQQMGPVLQVNASGLSVLMGILFFALAFFFLRKRSNRLAQKSEYRPRIIRVLK